VKKVVALFTTKEEHNLLNVLLVRNEEGTCWGLPGGKIEEGEEKRRALLRELDEEVPDLLVLDLNPIGSFSGKTPVSKKEMELIVFSGRTTEMYDVEEFSEMDESLPVARWVFWRRLFDNSYLTSEVTKEAAKKCLEAVARGNMKV